MYNICVTDTGCMMRFSRRPCGLCANFGSWDKEIMDGGAIMFDCVATLSVYEHCGNNALVNLPRLFRIFCLVVFVWLSVWLSCD